MSQALALIAHDLKNALGGLEAQLQAMAQADGPDPRTASEQALWQCQTLREEFVQFLTLYAAESGELRPLCEDESPTDFLQHIARQWQGRLQQQGRPLQVQVAAAPDAPPFWYFDRRLVRVALDAALHNAARFASQCIVLGCHTAQGRLVLTVQDDGPGLGQAPLQPDASPENNTGLGTTLCQAVAQAHCSGDVCGHIELQSPPQGGTCFALHLP